MAIGNTTRDFGNIPMSCALPVGDATPQPIRGGREYTDSQSNVSTNIVMSMEDGWKATYSASIIGLVPGATPQDIFTVTGSTSKVIRITTIRMSGLATAAVPIDVVFLKRSTANTAGTSTAPTRVAYDSTNPAVSATVLAYTVNPTAGSLVGNIAAFHMTLGIKTAATTAIGTDRLVVEPGDGPSQSIVLRGTGEVFAINLNGIAAVAGWVFDIFIEWTEE